MPGVSRTQQVDVSERKYSAGQRVLAGQVPSTTRGRGVSAYQAKVLSVGNGEAESAEEWHKLHGQRPGHSSGGASETGKAPTVFFPFRVWVPIPIHDYKNGEEGKGPCSARNVQWRAP